MADQSGSRHLQALFGSALQAYERKTGVTLAQHPLALKLQSRNSVEDITALLQDQAKAFTDSRAYDKTMRVIKTTVSILTPFSDAASLPDVVGPTLIPPAKAVHAGLAVLLNAAGGVISSYDALVDLLESIAQFVDRLNIYTRIPLTPEIVEMMVKIIVELLTILALVTKELKQRRPIKFVKKLLGEKDVEAVLQRLDRLTQDEVRTTAAQTLEVVYGLVHNTTVVMDDGKASIGDVQKVLEIVHQMASDMNKSKRGNLLKDIRRWLSPPDSKTSYDTALEYRHSETGAWFMNGNTLAEWKASESSSLLWIHGKTGSGKSVLCSTIIEDIEIMRKSGLASLAIFFYDFRETQRKGVRGLVSSVLVQLCRQSDAYCDILSELYSEHEDGQERPSDARLVRCLKDLLQIPRQAPIFLIMDALDECPNTPALSSPREQVLQLLESIINLRLPNLRICVTSRAEPDIKNVIEVLAFRSVSLHDESGQQEDMKNYVESVLNTNKKMRNWSLDHKQLAIDVLTKRADGMFRWLHCQLEYLASCLPARIQDALDELPATLDETYERSLREIDDTNWEFAQRLFLCVAAASRPLRVGELAEILAFDFGVGPIPKYREDWRVTDPVDAVLTTCPTLLSLVNVENSQVIQFAHFSVKEFLTSSRFREKHGALSHRYHISMTPAHTIVAQACLGILLYLDKDITRDKLDKFPLAEYAAEHWVEHARFEGLSENVGEGMKELFDARKPYFGVWLWICDPAVSSRLRNDLRAIQRPLPPRGTPLHYAAYLGLNDIVKVLIIEQPQDVNSDAFLNGGRDYKSTPLYLASRNGHIEAARVLVESGANLAARTNLGWTPLHSASFGGHLELSRFLVEEHGADVGAQANSGSTPLHQASEGGHLELARFLVEEHGADVAASTHYGWTPLHTASSLGHLNVAQFLVKEHGAGVSAQANDGSTPLYLASLRGHLDVARFLAEEHGADVNGQTNDGSTPLHHASEKGYLELARFLVKQGADAATRTNDGSTPLHQVGNVDLARFLVKEHGVDVDARTNDGSTLLHRASSKGHLELARFLVEELGADAAARTNDGSTPLHQVDNVDLARFLVEEQGADVAAQTNNGSTPLHRASFNGHLKVAQYLVEEHGADVAARTIDGSTPLHEVSFSGNVDFARFLVEHGADVAAQTNDGLTPLHRASEVGRLDFVRFLVEEHGADAGARANDGSTPLHGVSESFWADVDLTRLLIKHGADVDARNNGGYTPLHKAAYWGRLDFARLLVEEHGADVAVRADDGSTPLHEVSVSWGNVDLARFLVEHGADVAARTNDGYMPLHKASERGHVELVQLLVEHGADPAARANDGSTPWHEASTHGHMELAQFLLEHSADAAAQAISQTQHPAII